MGSKKEWLRRNKELLLVILWFLLIGIGAFYFG